jgi:hypothetical protein
LLGLSVALPACASTPAPDLVAALLDEAEATARRHVQNSNQAAAAQFVGAVLGIDDSHPGALQLNDEIAADEIEFMFDPGPLGSNVARRLQVDRSVAAQILLYLPDRILDLFDIFSFDVHIGLGALANVHLTRAVQFGAGGRAVSGIGWHDHRSLGVLAQTGSELVIPGVGAQAFAGALVGTSGVMVIGDGLAGVHTPQAELYQQYRDYCAIGVEATAGVAGVDFDIHPLEIFDFLVGWFTYDPLRDDFARTRGLGLSSSDRKLLWRLAEIRRSPDAMALYHAWRAKAVEAGSEQ